VLTRVLTGSLVDKWARPPAAQWAAAMRPRAESVHPHDGAGRCARAAGNWWTAPRAPSFRWPVHPANWPRASPLAQNGKRVRRFVEFRLARASSALASAGSAGFFYRCPAPRPVAGSNQSCRFSRRPARGTVGGGHATAGRERYAGGNRRREAAWPKAAGCAPRASHTRPPTTAFDAFAPHSPRGGAARLRGPERSRGRSRAHPFRTRCWQWEGARNARRFHDGRYRSAAQSARPETVRCRAQCTRRRQ
jgi:hypothetical protein